MQPVGHVEVRGPPGVCAAPRGGLASQIAVGATRPPHSPYKRGAERRFCPQRRAKNRGSAASKRRGVEIDGDPRSVLNSYGAYPCDALRGGDMTPRKKILLVDDTATITSLEKLILGDAYDYCGRAQRQ